MKLSLLFCLAVFGAAVVTATASSGDEVAVKEMPETAANTPVMTNVALPSDEEAAMRQYWGRPGFGYGRPWGGYGYGRPWGSYWGGYGRPWGYGGFGYSSSGYPWF